MPQERVAGFPTYWAKTGRGVRRALFIHCSLAHSGAWKGVQAQLATKLSMLSYDLPGHGRSADWDRRGDFQTVSADIGTALIDQRADLIGHSFGATVAMRIAACHPEKVRSLTLIEPVLFAAARATPVFAAHMAEMAPFGAAMQAEDLETATRLFNRVWGAGIPWDAIPQAQRDAMVQRIHMIPEGADVTNEDIHAQATPGALEAIRQPVLLIEGAQSPPIVGAVHNVFAARIPNVRRVVVAGAGHMAPITHPKAVAGEIADFLKV